MKYQVEGNRVFLIAADQDGQHKKMEVKGSSLADKINNAQRHIALYEAKASGNYRRHTVQSAFREILAVKLAQVGEKTQYRYTCFVNMWERWASTSILEKPISRLTKTDIMQFLDYLQSERKVSNYTRNNYLNDVNSFLNEMVERAVITKNPGKGIRRLKQVEKKNVAFSEEQRRILENYLTRHDYDLFVFTRFIYYTFIRPVELLRIKIKDIDEAGKVIIVRSHQSKNKRQMPVTIPEGLDPFLEEMNLKQYNPNFLLFAKGLKPGQEVLSRKSVTDRHTKALKKCGVYDGEVTMYSWKHLGNCNAYKAGADIKALQLQNRHHSLEMTDKYLRSLGVQQQSRLRRLRW
jgi:integrase